MSVPRNATGASPDEPCEEARGTARGGRMTTRRGHDEF
jgi:hypothetical protein